VIDETDHEGMRLIEDRLPHRIAVPCNKTLTKILSLDNRYQTPQQAANAEMDKAIDGQPIVLKTHQLPAMKRLYALVRSVFGLEVPKVIFKRLQTASSSSSSAALASQYNGPDCRFVKGDTCMLNAELLDASYAHRTVGLQFCVGNNAGHGCEQCVQLAVLTKIQEQVESKTDKHALVSALLRIGNIPDQDDVDLRSVFDIEAVGATEGKRSRPIGDLSAIAVTTSDDDEQQPMEMDLPSLETLESALSQQQQKQQEDSHSTTTAAAAEMETKYHQSVERELTSTSFALEIQAKFDTLKLKSALQDEVSVNSFLGLLLPFYSCRPYWHWKTESRIWTRLLPN